MIEDEIRDVVRDLPTIRQWCERCGGTQDSLGDFFTPERARLVADLIEAAREHACSDPECWMRKAIAALDAHPSVAQSGGEK